MLMVSLPTTVYANEYIVSKVESLIAWGYWAVLLGALSGGVAATFIKTEVDDRLSYDILAKLFKAILQTNLIVNSALSEIVLNQ